MPDDHRARKRAREDILLRFRELSWQDQYKTYNVIQGYFIHNGVGSEALKELRERAECVAAVKKAAEYLGLADGEAPGVKEYERVRREAGIELSSATIIRRWEVWREVAKAARGERVSLTARQRAQFRAAIKQKQSGEEWLTGVREWLSERPSTRYARDYDAWAQEHNEQNPKLPPISLADNVRRSLVLPWNLILKVAERDLSLADAQARELQRLKSENDGFVSSAAVALINGVTQHRTEFIASSEGFPNYVFKMRASYIWHLSDVEAHAKGEPFPERVPGGLQHQILDRPQILRVCDLTPGALSHALSRGNATAPRAAGRVRGLHYWFRLSVEAWAEVTGNEAALVRLASPMLDA
jgi:hypothetical protein